jgi:predicted nucleotidyltransferase
MTTKEYILSTIRENKKELLRFGILEIGLFGSYVRGDESEKSDIDLLIDFDPALENFDNYMAVCNILEQLFKNEKLEIVTKK